MDSTGGIPGEARSTPEREAIQAVLSACNCTEEQAINLLQYSNNDVEKAKRRHKLRIRFMPPVMPKRTRPPVPPKRPSLTSNFRDESDLDTDSEEKSNEGELYDTPRTEEDQLLTSARMSQRSSGTGYPANESGDPKNEENGYDDIAKSSVLTTEIHDQDSESIAPSLEDLQSPDPLTETPIEEPQDTDIRGAEESLVEAPLEELEWNFVLPRIWAPLTLTPGVAEFNLSDLVGTLQQGLTKGKEEMIEDYLRYFNQSIVQHYINSTVEGFPSIFFAVETNNDWALRMWIKYGADINAIHESSQVPLLAFAIMHSENIQTDTTDVVASLLSLGASPNAIPTVFYTPYCRDLPDDGPDDETLEDLDPGTKKWLTKTAKARLARTANLTHRYNLERAAKTKKPSIRHKQVARLRKAEPLLGLPYFLIGQTLAANRVLQKCISHLAVPGKKPLVLAFAGPSGHGKTELARRLGYLLSLELEVVDCTSVTREIELFGGRHPFANADQGTSLNNFLVRNSGKRSIVFLDEFEKTTTQVHHALLLPFDNGEYQDRTKTNENRVDCSKTIWILATNALDPTIERFCHRNEQAIFHDEDESKKMRLMKSLSKELKREFLSEFGAPITGRISTFIPFLTFSPSEAAVVAHKYLLELGKDVRNPVKLNNRQDERLVGNVKLHVRRDASVCRNLADDGYNPALGTRSLIEAVAVVREILIDSYLDVDQSITEQDDPVDFVVDINGEDIIANMLKPKVEQQVVEPSTE